VVVEGGGILGAGVVPNFVAIRQADQLLSLEASQGVVPEVEEEPYYGWELGQVSGEAVEVLTYGLAEEGRWLAEGGRGCIAGVEGPWLDCSRRAAVLMNIDCVMVYPGGFQLEMYLFHTALAQSELEVSGHLKQDLEYMGYLHQLKSMGNQYCGRVFADCSGYSWKPRSRSNRLERRPVVDKQNGRARVLRLADYSDQNYSIEPMRIVVGLSS
jgi:hypothetical protein